MPSRLSRRAVPPFLVWSLAGSVLLSATLAGQQPKPSLVPVVPKEVPAAAAPLPETGRAPATPAPQLTAADLDAFLDGVVSQQLRATDVAGAVVSIVKDGKVLFAKGYGYADVARRTPVSVDSTLFRIGSVSKTFTWTAVMQLVEQGRIDLDRDVNGYLDYEIPATFGKPVTMRNLMTHTPGFEEVLKDLLAPDSTHLRPLKVWLPDHLPRQIYPPGTTPAYSNYGATLAGYIVERTSGMSFDAYVAKNIFTPLGLAHTTFLQPLPAALAPLASKGYRVASQKAKPFEYVAAAPAGSVSATGADMARYMIAYLENEGAPLMKPETRRLMFSRAFELSPAVHGMAHGFYEETRNGHRIVGHGGDTQWFHSDLHLMPDDHVGFFVSYNSAGNGKAELRGALWRGFLDRYFPYVPPPVVVTATHLEHARAVAGRYRSSRRAETTIASSISMVGQSAVKLNADSTISNGSVDGAGNPKRYREVAPWVFREVNGQDRVAFPTNYAGQRIMVGDMPVAIGHPASSLKNGKLNLVCLGITLGIFALTLLGWPAAALLRRHYSYHLTLGADYRRRRLVIRLACLLCLLFVGLWVQFVSGVQNDITRFNAGADAHLRLLQLLALLGALGAIAALLHAARSWADRAVWRWSAVWNTLVAAGFVWYVVFLLDWHLLTPSLRY